MGIRELRQQTSELVRRASAGEEVVVAVSGYPAARLGPLAGRRWRRGSDVAGLLAASADLGWDAERRTDDGDAIDAVPRDPWEGERSAPRHGEQPSARPSRRASP